MAQAQMASLMKPLLLALGESGTGTLQFRAGRLGIPVTLGWEDLENLGMGRTAPIRKGGLLVAAE
jgi:hypothetical protein